MPLSGATYGTATFGSLPQAGAGTGRLDVAANEVFGLIYDEISRVSPQSPS